MSIASPFAVGVLAFAPPYAFVFLFFYYIIGNKKTFGRVGFFKNFCF